MDWSFPSHRQAQGNGMSCTAPGMKGRKQTRYCGQGDGGGEISRWAHPVFHVCIYVSVSGRLRGISRKLESKRTLY